MEVILGEWNKKLVVHWWDISEGTRERPFCSYGCMTSEKQGTAVSWLAEAERNGAICIQKCQVCGGFSNSFVGLTEPKLKGKNEKKTTKKQNADQ